MHITLSEQIWNADPESRTHAEWGLILEILRGSLSEFLALPVVVLDYWTDNGPDDRLWSVCSRIRVPVSQALQSCFVGSLCLSVNRKERVSISADLLCFVGGVRYAGHPLGDSKGKDVLVLNFEPEACSIGRWTSPVMEADEYGEWEAFQSLDDLKSRY